MIHVQRILYPTDFSSYSNQAYFHAVALARTHKASLTVVYVHVPGTSPLDGAENRVADRSYWQGQLEQIRPLDASIPVQHVLLEGDPAAQIVQFARDGGIELIVMGTHGRTGKERLLLGSVAEKVMRDAPCSVMVVKLPRASAAPQPTAVASAK
jgi:nucleotide-binding universal stress UspA family protein